MDKGTWLSVGIITLVMLIYGGVKLYGLNIEKKTENVNNQIRLEGDKIDTNDVIRVADFQNRIEEISRNIGEKNNPNDILEKVSNVIMKDSYITSYDYTDEKKSIALNIVASDIEDSARQILSLKSPEYFSSVEVFGDYFLDEETKEVLFDANLVLSSTD